jgi:hypothetical protein
MANLALLSLSHHFSPSALGAELALPVISMIPLNGKALRFHFSLFPPFAMIYSHHDSDYPSSPGTIEAEFMPRSASCGVGGRKKGFLRHQQLTQSGELSEKYQLI